MTSCICKYTYEEEKEEKEEKKRRREEEKGEKETKTNTCIVRVLSNSIFTLKWQFFRQKYPENIN